MYYQSTARFPILLALSGQELDILQVSDLSGKGVLRRTPEGRVRAGTKSLTLNATSTQGRAGDAAARGADP